MSSSLVGRTIGNYVVRREVGRGGMGTVYYAQHPRLQRAVAVKVLRDELGRDPAIVWRFFNEARAASDIRNVHIVDVIDFGELAEGTPYLMMEWLEGRSLAQELLDSGRLSLPRTAHIVTGIAAALSAAHEHGVIHRDLKPDNIFLIEREGDRDFVKVVDFGVAKLLVRSDASAPRTAADAVLGTPEYMSPEQCRAQNSTLDGRSDLYALGVIAFEMLCGRLPFQAVNYVGHLVAHLSQTPPSPLELVPSLPQAAARAVLKALEKNRDLRQGSVREFAAELQAAAREAPADEGGPAGRTLKPQWDSARTIPDFGPGPRDAADDGAGEGAAGSGEHLVGGTPAPGDDPSGERRPTWEPSRPARPARRAAREVPPLPTRLAPPPEATPTQPPRAPEPVPPAPLLPKVVLALGAAALLVVVALAALTRARAPSPAGPSAAAGTPGASSPASPASTGSAAAGAATPAVAAPPLAAETPRAPTEGAALPAAGDRAGADAQARTVATSRPPVGATSGPAGAPAAAGRTGLVAAPGDADYRPAHVERRVPVTDAPPVESDAVLERRLLAESAHLAPSGRRYGPVLSGAVGRVQPGVTTASPAAGRELFYSVELEGGFCYTFVGVASGGVPQLHTVLWDPSGKKIGEHASPSPVSCFTACAFTSGPYRFQARAPRGAGRFRAAVLRSS